MSVGIVFASFVMPVLRDRFMRCQLFQPPFIVLVKSRLIVVNKHGGGNVHGVNQNQALPNAAFCEASLNFRSNVYKTSPCRKVKPEFLAIGLHGPPSNSVQSSKFKVGQQG